MTPGRIEPVVMLPSLPPDPAVPEPAPALSRPIEPSAAIVQPRLPDSSLPPIAPPQTAAPEPAEPRIEVRIGRVEIKAAPPPVRPPAPARRTPKGFGEHAAARSFRDRKW